MRNFSKLSALLVISLLAVSACSPVYDDKSPTTKTDTSTADKAVTNGKEMSEDEKYDITFKYAEAAQALYDKTFFVANKMIDIMTADQKPANQVFVDTQAEAKTTIEQAMTDLQKLVPPETATGVKEYHAALSKFIGADKDMMLAFTAVTSAIQAVDKDAFEKSKTTFIDSLTKLHDVSLEVKATQKTMADSNKLKLIK